MFRSLFGGLFYFLVKNIGYIVIEVSFRKIAPTVLIVVDNVVRTANHGVVKEEYINIIVQFAVMVP